MESHGWGHVYRQEEDRTRKKRDTTLISLYNSHCYVRTVRYYCESNLEKLDFTGGGGRGGGELYTDRISLGC